MRSRFTLTLAVAVAALAALFGSLSPTVGARTTSTSTTPASTTSGNLLTGNQANFNGTTGGWVPSNATLSSPGPGSTSLQVTATANSSVSAWSALPPSGTPTPAIAGDKYIGEANIEATIPTQSIGDALAFVNAAGTIINAVWGQVVTPPLANWTTLPQVAAIAPTGTASVVLGVVAWNDLTGLNFLIQAPVLSVVTTPPVAPSVVGPLHTSGNQIVQGNGKTVTLRGLVMPGLEQSGTLPGPGGVSQRAVNEAKAWGANFVRVPLGEQFWLSSNCDYVSSYISTVDQVVNWITSQGMVALLDLHTNTVGAITLSGCEQGVQHNMADEAQSPTFWSQVAARYGNPRSPEYSRLVAFDLYNEPHDITNSVWLNGGSTLDLTSATVYRAAGMQQLYNTVRGAGSQNLVFISGLNWANTPPTTLVSGSNIVYAVHYYTCPSTPLSICANPNPYDPTPGLSPWVPLSATHPVVVTEFGFPSQASGNYNGNVIAYASSHGWGWTAYAFEDRQYATPWDLIASWLSDGTAEPSPSGTPAFLSLSQST
jgi:hypothetical protein